MQLRLMLPFVALLLMAQSFGFAGWVITHLNLYGDLPPDMAVVGAIWFGLGIATLLVNLVVFWKEYLYVTENATIIEKVLVEVDQVRAARGLPTNAKALAAQM